MGGIARFQTLCNSYASSDEKYAGQPELVTLFSGDAFNPSLESSVTKGLSSYTVEVLAWALLMIISQAATWSRY